MKEVEVNLILLQSCLYMTVYACLVCEEMWKLSVKKTWEAWEYLLLILAKDRVPESLITVDAFTIFVSSKREKCSCK